MKATFLLGSGISRPAKLASVDELTELVLSGNGLIVEADGSCVAWDSARVRPEHEEVEGQALLRKIRTLLDWLREKARARYAEFAQRQVNYEDLAYLAGQLEDDLLGDYENPALQPFIRNALIDLHGLFQEGACDKAREGLRVLAGTAVDYIRQVVALKLSVAPSDTSYLQPFLDACRDSEVSELNLFTLNHDTVLEDFLTANGVDVADGLRDASNGDGSRRWDPSVYDDSRCRARIFKLHGSVDWFRWEPYGGPWKDEALAESTDRSDRFVGTYHPKDPMRPLYEQVSGQPTLLAGTFNKILAYNSGIFLELHHRFHRALSDCQTLVICGYGFADKGINTRIAEWRHLPSVPKLVIIDPAESLQIVQRARGAIQREIAALHPDGYIGPLSPGLVVHWQHGLEARSAGTGDALVTWERIRAAL